MRRIEFQWIGNGSVTSFRVWNCECGALLTCNPFSPEMEKETHAHCGFCTSARTKEWLKEHYYDSN
jgi:hypothetical protein